MSSDGNVPGISTRLVALAARRVYDHVEAALASEDVSAEQWRVLDYLHQHGGCTMSHLAAATSLNGSTLTRIVDRLTMSALAYRNADPTDRRRVLVHLSSRGRALTRRLRPRVLEAESAAVSGLMPDEQRKLADLLEQMTLEHTEIDALSTARG